MPYQQPVKSPNLDKLFLYLQKSQWHNVSANFSGFVRKEFETNLEKLEDDELMYKNLKEMLEYSEMGRFTEAKTLIDPAYKEYHELLNKLTDLQIMKSSPRRAPQHTDRRDTNTPVKREVSSPVKRNIQTPNQRQHPASNTDYDTHRRQNETNDRGGPRTPQYQTEHDRKGPGTPQYQTERDRKGPGTPQFQSDRDRTQQYQQDQQHYDTHRENYNSLRLNSPQKQENSYQPPNKLDTARSATNQPVEGPSSFHPDRRSPPVSAVLTNSGQMVSSKELWGHEHGDKPSEKVGYSTYRNDFPTYSVDNSERKDKERYRENFNSLAERNMYRGGDEGSNKEELRQSRYSDTPDFDNRPTELARKFKELYSSEWTDAYDEICKDFGSEKTVRHLLWIVTEAALIANDVADHQLRGLEKQAFGVMANPGDDNEAWLTAGDVANKQVEDLEKAALGLMTTPGQGDHGGYVPRHLGETLPASRSLLLKYRKQTALLSIPYVKEECRDKITRTLIESAGFPKGYFNDASRLTTYIYRCAELVWLMCVQNPPIVLEYITRDTEGARFNQEHYNVYTKAGTTYDFGVWPMLRLGKRGQILAKGIAQGI